MKRIVVTVTTSDELDLPSVEDQLYYAAYDYIQDKAYNSSEWEIIVNEIVYNK